MHADEPAPGLRDYLQILRRRWLLMAAIALTVVVTALLTSLRMTPVYQAAGRLEVQPVFAASLADGGSIEGAANPAVSMATQVELIRSEGVLGRAAEELGLPTSAGLEEGIEVEQVQDTQILEIRAEHPDPGVARDRANAVAKAYIEFRRDRAIETVVAASEDIGRRIKEVKAAIAEQDRILADQDGAGAGLQAEKAKLEAEVASLQAKAASHQPSPAPPNRSVLAQIEKTRLRISELERQIADLASGGGGPKAERDTLVARLGALEAQRQWLPDAAALRRGGGSVIGPAEAPAEPIRPNLPRNLLFAAAAGLALAAGMAFLAEQLDDRLRSHEEVERRVGAPILGRVPFVRHWQAAGGSVAALTESASGGAEAYRTLRTNLRFLSQERPIRTLLVTSAVAEEGKTTTAANLAVVFAQGGTRTILAAADLRRPGVHRLFGLNGSGGLLDALEGSPLARALRTTGVPNLELLADGASPPNPTEILASPRFDRLVGSLCESADLVVFDSPPVLGMADASVLASRVDGVLLVVNGREVTRRALVQAAEQIRRAGGRILGLVMNAVETQDGYYYGYYYGSDHAGGNGDSRQKGRPLIGELEEETS